MKMIIYLAIVSVLFIVYVRYLERTSLFYPTKPFAATPDVYQLSFEDVYIQTAADIKLHGWFVNAPQAKSTLLFFHGNAGNIGDRLGKILFFHQLGLNVLIIDYRGYGKSEGKPTEEGMYQDALAAYSYLIEDRGINPQNVVIYGASLGGTAAVDLASQRQAGALIVDSSFSNAVDMAKKIYPFIPSFLINIKLDSLNKIENVAIPKLFIHSVDDQLVPIELGKKLYNAASEPKKFFEVSGGHNDDYFNDHDGFIETISAFLKELELI